MFVSAFWSFFRESQNGNPPEMRKSRLRFKNFQKIDIWPSGSNLTRFFGRATPVRGLLHVISSKPLELEGWVKKRNCSIFYALQICTQTFFSKVDSFHAN